MATRASTDGAPVSQSVPSFVDTVPDDLQCAICLGAAIVAHVTEECGHLYCRDCIMGALDNKKECPYCRGPLTAEGVRKSVWHMRKVQALTVCCDIANLGCTWTGEFGGLDKHLETCSYVQEACPLNVYGCNAAISRNALAEHMSACPIVRRLSEGDAALRRELHQYRSACSGQFDWVIENFERKDQSSHVFVARGLQWKLYVEGPKEKGACDLYLTDAVDHGKRPEFTLTLVNDDEEESVIVAISDWPAAEDSWGWGGFIPGGDLGDMGFLVNGSLRIRVGIDRPV